MPSPHKKKSLVSIQQTTYDAIDLDALLTPFGGLAHYVKKGDRVVLKVNLLSASTPDEAVTTNPALVRKTAEAVLSLGATPLIADSPSGQFTKRRLKKVYTKTGMLALSRDLGIDLNYDTSVITVPVPDGKRLTTIPLCNYIKNADVIIGLPKLKTHSFMIMTLATKIMFGAVPGLTKAKYHALHPRRQQFSDMLLDVLSVASPRLIIMDGIIAMEGEGPGSGTPLPLGLLLASEDPFALDLAVCTILRLEPVGIPVLKQARLRGLWPEQITYPLLKPEQVTHNGFVLPKTADYLLTGEKTPAKHPVVTSKCISCGLCQEICPKHAITNKPDRAYVDYSKCIRCYCCHEICPKKAILLQEITQEQTVTH